MPAAEPNSSTLQEVSSSVYPGLEKKPGKQNWVDKAGGLPSYIERIAKHLHYEKGKDVGTAIAIAVNTVKRWATGTNHNGSKLKPATVAKAQKAVAEWMEKRGKSKLKEAAVFDDDSLVLSSAEVASLIGAFTHRLTLVEGMAIGLKGKGTARRSGRVAGALALVEGREAKMVLDGGNADPRELARAQSMLGSEIAEMRVILEALGAAPVIPRSPAGPPAPRRRGNKPQAKGRNGQAIFDESQHPRASKGRVAGGQFIRAGASGAEVKGIQRAVGAKPDGKFGRDTKKKVEAFQQSKGLTKDGVVGAQTAAALTGAEGIPGPLLSHHRANLRAAKQRFTPAAMAAADAKEKSDNKARKARKEAKKEAESSSSSSSSSTPSTASSSSSTSSKSGGAGSTFGAGSSLPPKVAELIQRKLGIESSGSFDDRTKERVEEFQKANGLQVDGIVGTQTLAALRGDESPPAPGGFSESDWTWLSSHQAGGQREKRHDQQVAKQEVRDSSRTSKQTEAERDKERKRIERERKREQGLQEMLAHRSAAKGFASVIAGDSFKFDPKLHPRDRRGKFSEVLNKLSRIAGKVSLSGGTMGDDTTVFKKLTGGFDVHHPATGTESFKSAADAADRALTIHEKQRGLIRKSLGLSEAAIEEDVAELLRVQEAVTQDDFHRKYGAGMTDQPDEATGHLQNRLAELGYDAGANDGRFGEKTKGAVANFQKDHGLKDDGEVGATTKIALRGTDPEEVAKSRERASGVKVEDEETSQKADTGATSTKAKPSAKDGAPEETAAEDSEEVMSQSEDETPSLAGTVLTKGTGVAEEQPDPAVKHLQKTIGAEADGRFGPETEKKLKSTQRRYGLKADGVVGPKTGRLLDRMASKTSKKPEVEKKLDEAILERMEAGVSGDTGAFTRARAKETTLREAALRGFLGNAVSELYRLDDGTFAPKGRGKILKPGQKITLPHRSGSGKIAAKVEHVSGGRGLARITDGPDSGHLVSVRTAAPQGSRARPFPDLTRRLRDLPPGDPAKPSQVAEVNAQNALDHINYAITKGDDFAVQDHLDDMGANHAWAEKHGHQPALSRYDKAKEAGEHFLKTGEELPAFQAAPVDTGEPIHKPGSFTQFPNSDLETMLKNTHAMGDQPEQAAAMQRELDRREGAQQAPIDFASASDGQLDGLISAAIDENGLPRSGRDRSVFLTALAEKKRRAKRSFDTSRSDAAKEAASNSYAQVTGQRLMQPAVQFAPPEGFEPNASEKQLKDMKPGDTFYVGKHDEAYKWHKPTPGGPFIISKPVDGGKAKVFHQEFAPPFIGPGDPEGSPSASAPTPAPPATNDEDLYGALKDSLAQGGSSAPTAPASSGPSPARSAKGNLRNFKAMSDEKLTDLASEMQNHPDDIEAVKAITAELKSRADGTAAKTAAVKSTSSVDLALAHVGIGPKGSGVSASGEEIAAKAGAPSPPKTAEPAKVKKSEEKIAAAWAAYDKKKADFDALPNDTDKKAKAKAAAQVRAAKFRIKRVGGDFENRPDTGPVVVKTAGPKSKGHPIPPPPESVMKSEPPPAEIPEEAAQVMDDAAAVENTNLTLDEASNLLGEGWSGATVTAALDKLETSGIVFDRQNESPATIAAVIKAAGFSPEDMKTDGTK